MNGPEILHLIRHELQDAVGWRGTPPAPRPMDVSPWLAMAVLQKAIRRGREDLALSAAATLLQDAPERLWRRIGCIAFEDVGIACLDAVGLATVALAGKQVRAALGGEWVVASCIVSELCRVPKCRAADDLLMACGPCRSTVPDHPRPDRRRDRAGVRPGTGIGALVPLGTDRRRSSLAMRRGEPRLVFDYLCEAGWPHSVVEVAHEGFRRTGEMLCPFVALLSCEHHGATRIESDEFPAEVMIGDVPSWPLDVYRGRAGPRSDGFLRPMRRPRDGCAATSGRPVGWRSSATSSFGSKAGSSPAECGGRSRTISAVKRTSSARVPTARTRPKSWT